jgi:hypothetical protein
MKTQTLLTGALVLVSTVALLAVDGYGAALRVPQDYPSITAASNAAEPGDSILVWPPLVGTEWENQTITLQQGVTLRGMTDLDSGDMVVLNSVIYMLEGQPSSEDDTTRVENFPITTTQAGHENIQVYTPRSSIVGCVIGGFGPEGTPCVRVWKGGLITRNGIYCEEGVTAREGIIRVVGNWFETNLRSVSIFNQGAPGPASAEIRNNTVHNGSQMVVALRADSHADVVNNILHGGIFVFCTPGVDIRYNDFVGGGASCTLGVGNISADPQFCSIESILRLGVEPDSPCVGAGENGSTMGAGGICGVTGIEAEESAPPRVRLMVHPNPGRGAVEFTFSDAVSPTLEIYDSEGRVIDVIRAPRDGFVWTPNQPLGAGVYFARLDDAGRSQVVKFVLLR